VVRADQANRVYGHYALVAKMADPEYRKELLEKKIDFSSDLESVISEIEFYQSESDGKTPSTKRCRLIRLPL
jgi:hypothetical protein